MALLLAWTSVYAAGSGVFLSAFCKTTLTAAMVSLGQLAFFWGILPFLLPPVAGALAPSNPRQFCEQTSGYFNASPLHQLFDTVEDSGGHESRQIKSQIGRGAEDSIPQANFAEPPSDEDLRELARPSGWSSPPRTMTTGGTGRN